MKVEDIYDDVISVIQIQEQISKDITRVTDKVFTKWMRSHPIHTLSLFWKTITASKHSPPIIPPSLESKMRIETNKLLKDSQEYKEMHEVFFAKDFYLALAREVNRRVPNVRFGGLLELHQYRNPKKSIFKNKNFYLALIGLIFSIQQRLELELFDSITIKLPYESMPSEIFDFFWWGVAAIFMFIILYLILTYKRYESYTLVTAERTFIIGKILEEYKKS